MEARGLWTCTYKIDENEIDRRPHHRQGFVVSGHSELFVDGHLKLAIGYSGFREP